MTPTERAPTAPRAGRSRHFLSRLCRLKPEQAEVALLFHGDEELLRFVLTSAGLPLRVARAALSLGHAELGPFVIVTREGQLVTCLGRGMGHGRLPVITRAALDTYLARAAETRGRGLPLFGHAERRRDMLRQLLDAADDCSGEQIEETIAAAPPPRAVLVGMAAQAAKELEALRAALVPVLQRTRHPGPATYPALRAYWKLAFAVGHLSVLLGAGGAGIVDEVPALVTDGGPALSLLAVQQGIVGVAVKGIWAAGQIGGELLSAYARAFAESCGQVQIADAALALTVIALRHPERRAEVLAALAEDRAAFRDDETRALAEALAEQARAVLHDPAGALALHEAYGAERVARLSRELPEGSPWRFARAADVPARLSMTAGAALYQDFIGDTRHLFGMFALLPWLARATAAELYLPAPLLAATRAPFRPADAIAMLGGHAARLPEPGRSTPSRAAPCPCGSRKKFRRCCGEEGRGAEMPKAA